MTTGRPTTLATLERGGDEDALTFTASSTSLNRYGFRLRHSGWKLDNFNLNPVILYQHMAHVPPIGRGRASRKSGNVNIGITFDREDPFAAAIERKYRAGIMHAVSVGFDFVDKDGAPLKNWWSMTAEQIEKEAYYDLAEVSAVAVPADPQAVRQQHAALSTAGMELLDLAGWQRGEGGMLSPPTGDSFGKVGDTDTLIAPVPPTLPGNSDFEQRLADLEARFESQFQTAFAELRRSLGLDQDDEDQDDEHQDQQEGDGAAGTYTTDAAQGFLSAIRL